MSGDVQPRKRKDKKKKKDDLGTEEPRGTAAALGEGDVFMHSYSDHGTGGHWCAKIIFFSLLAVLVTLIGLIILENRGLTELEANSVESRYSGVLEGWIEDATDDHHDEHTLELKHHEDDEDHPDDQLDENEAEEESLEEEIDHNDDDAESIEDEGESDEIEEENNDEDDDDGEGDEEDDSQNEEDGIGEEDEIQNDDDEEVETHNDEDEGQDENSDEDDGKYDEEIEDNLKDHEDDEEETYEHYSYEEISKPNNDIDENDDEDDEDNEDNEVEEEKHNYLSKEKTSNYNYHESYENNGDDDESQETKYDDENESNEHNTEDEASEEDDQEVDDDDEQEIEKIEKEIFDGDDSEETEDDHAPARDTSKENDKEDTSKEDDEPPIEKISRPQAGKPFVEIEEETPIKPVDTLAEEEAYERQQEELRREEEQAPHSLWLKLCVGGALLAATHALVRRATRSDAPETEEPVMEETPSLIDRRMTIIDEPIRVTQTSPSQVPRQIVDEEVFKRPAPVAQSAPITKPKIAEEIAKEVVAKVLELPKSDSKKEEEKELYSEEEEEEDEDEDVEEDNEPDPKKEPAKKQEAEESEPEPEPEEVSDVEIIYDETVEEEEIPDEEIEEEEISDVDDAELLSRLEAKYGRLPEPERPGQYKGGGNSLEVEWPGEPSDPYWRSQLDTAEEEFRQGLWAAAAARAGGAGLANCGRARWLRAVALDRAADSGRDNRLLADAVAAYLHLLKMNEALSDERLLEVARRTVDRIQFRGTYLRAEPVYRLLIRRFPDDVNFRNNLTVTYLMANRADLADEVLRETLRIWPNDRVALAHRGFVLKIHYNKLEEAVRALREALEGDAGRANEPRFYYHLGDALLMLGRFDEAHKVHERGAELGHFLSPSQRSLYNVPRLRGRPWWRVEDTPYVDLAKALEASWRDILKEGQAAVALYEQEKEGLKERGEWSQLDIFVRGREVGGRCARAPAVCAALRGAGRGAGEGESCRRGQVKFSMMTPGTHVRPHVGPTNCRLRMHLALSNTEGTYIRVDKEIRQWQLGKTFIFDDSFEHEVWHNGTGTRLVLIVDVWHPDLTAAERRRLPAI